MTFNPSGITLDVIDGTSLFDAARNAGLPVASSCDAEFICGKCNMQVVAGGDAVSRQSEEERALLKKERNPTSDRVSCQTFVHGNCTVSTRYW